MKIITGQNFIKKRIIIDNKHFDDCHFTECLFLYSGEPFQITDSKFNGVSIRFCGAAYQMIHLLAHWKINPQDYLKSGNPDAKFDLKTMEPLGGEQ